MVNVGRKQVEEGGMEGEGSGKGDSGFLPLIYCKLKNQIVTGGLRRQGSKTEGKFTGIQDLSALPNLTTSGLSYEMLLQNLATSGFMENNAKLKNCEIVKLLPDRRQGRKTGG